MTPSLFEIRVEVERGLDWLGWMNAYFSRRRVEVASIVARRAETPGRSLVQVWVQASAAQVERLVLQWARQVDVLEVRAQRAHVEHKNETYEERKATWQG